MIGLWGSVLVIRRADDRLGSKGIVSLYLGVNNEQVTRSVNCQY